MSMRRGLSLFALLLAFSLVVAACGDDDAGETTETTAAETTETTAAETTETTAAETTETTAAAAGIEGEVKVPNVVVNGTVIGDVHALSHVELAAQARVHGNVYYSLIEMAMGAEVNGNLVHRSDKSVVSMPKKEQMGKAEG